MKKINFTLLVIILASQYLFGQSHGSIKTEHNSSTKKQVQFASQELFVGGSERIFEYRIPSLITTKRGTLIAVCDARVDKPGDAPNNIDLVMKRSSDEGKTWPTRLTINTGIAGYSCFTQLPDGNIGLLYEADINYKKRYYERILFVEIPYQELF